jgi:hypothetical protein
MSVQDVLQLRFSYVDVNDRMQSVLAYQSNQTSYPYPEKLAQDFAQAFDTANRTSLLNCWPVSTQFTSNQARRINNTGGPSYYGGIATGVTGTFVSTGAVDGSIAAVFTYPYNENLFGISTVYKNLAIALSAVLTGSIGTYTPGIWSRKYNQFIAGGNWQWVPTIGCIRKRSFPAR